MVRIIEPGNPELLKPWYCRKVWLCLKCNCKWAVEPEDEVKEHDDQRDGLSAEMPCPTCGVRVFVYPDREI